MQRALDWLAEARAERRAAAALLHAGHWSWCCFTCQQAGEKALRAVCESLRAPQFGHNLNVLVQHIEQSIHVPEAVRLTAARLNRLYIPTRCPDAFDRGAPADQYI